ncbi:hypothetical protein VT84_37730 [Gemmata sp. SH-PL17]|nr:hypothetical protein [Gemmata sp. SH-PL17]AMV30194.1 hypothetical protein VT84_37730 [Gemmata sp. SH-PL17]
MKTTDKISLALLSFFVWIVLPALGLFLILDRWFDRGGFWHFR